MIPSISQCTELMGRYDMLANIRDHSLMVARVADLLCRELEQAGVGVDHELAVAGALLHDIAKTKCLDSRCNHAEVGLEICLSHGFIEVAEIVGEHVVLSDFAPEQLTAKEIVYYADKRVNHDKIVSLHDRLAYILERYGQGDPSRTSMIHANFSKCCSIEERIFNELAIVPHQVAGLVMEIGFLDTDYAAAG